MALVDMHTRLPASGQDLEAVVKATEAAANTIMECAEAVMAADASDPDQYKAFVARQMLAVFEACSFQDLTGQRVARVREALKLIEARVARLAEATRIEDPRGFASDQEAAEAERKARPRVHGPAAKPGVTQADIDKLFR
jgi:chemotaxis protein CheZ